MLVWGSLYAAAGGSPRLPLWTETHNPDLLAYYRSCSWSETPPHRNTRRLDNAIARYERHAAYRPDGWPLGGAAALATWIALHHPQTGPASNAAPRCLAYDVQAFSRFTKQLAAYARLRADPSAVARRPRRPRRLPLNRFTFTFRKPRPSAPAPADEPPGPTGRQLAAAAYARRLPRLVLDRLRPPM